MVTSARTIELIDHDAALERLQMPQGLEAKTVTVAKRPRFTYTQNGFVLTLNPRVSLPLLTETVLENVLEVAGIPKGLAKKTPEKLIAPLVEYHLGRLDKVRVISDARGLVGLAPTDKTHPIFSPEKTLAALQKQFPGVLHQQALLDDRFNINLLTITSDQRHKLEEHLAPGTHSSLPDGGDPFMGGAHIRVNALGLEAPLIEPYMVRLVCTNGAIHAEYISGRGDKGYGEGDEIWQWFRDGMTAAAGAITPIMNTYSNMLGHEIPEGEQRMLAVEGMIRQTRLPRDMAQAVRDSAIANPPKTMYDLFNMLTEVSTHHTKGLENQVKYMRRAGEQATPDQMALYCPTCHRN